MEFDGRAYMFHQIADSDTTFIVTVAIIAGIVLVFMAVAVFMLLRSEQKKDSPIPSNEEAKHTLPVDIVVMSPQLKGPEDALSSIPPVEIMVPPLRKESPENARPLVPGIEVVAASAPKESEEHALPSMAPIETTPSTPTEEGPKPKFEFNSRTKEALWGIPLTALLMSCFILGLFYAYTKIRMLPGFWDPYGLGILNLLFAGTALGGSIGLRVVRLSWRQVVIASLLAGAILLIFARLRPSYTFPGDLVTLIFVAGGVFFLPLLDPEVRRNGPASSPWKVALAAFILSILVIRSTVFNSPLGGFIPFLLGMGIVLGLLLRLSRKEKDVSDGAWVGELSVLLTLFLVAILLSGFRI